MTLRVEVRERPDRRILADASNLYFRPSAASAFFTIFRKSWLSKSGPGTLRLVIHSDTSCKPMMSGFSCLTVRERRCRVGKSGI